MTIQDLGSLGELVAAIATVATLGYLAVQIRQNTASVRMASHRGVADQFQLTNLTVLQDPAIAEIVMRGLPDSSSLSEVERFRFELFLMAIFRTYEELYQLSQKGMIDPDLWECREQSMIYWLSHQSVSSWWASEQRVTFVSSFSTHVERRLSESQE